MRDRIKRVDKDYWFIVFLWAVGSVDGKNIAATILSGAVIAGYLVYTISGDADG